MNPEIFLAAATPATSGWERYNGFLLMGIMFAIFYFLLIAPMRKKQKVHSDLLSDLKNGDRVITNGGIHGTVVGVHEAMIQLRVADNVKIDLTKSAVAAFQNTEE